MEDWIGHGVQRAARLPGQRDSENPSHSCVCGRMCAYTHRREKYKVGGMIPGRRKMVKYRGRAQARAGPSRSTARARPRAAARAHATRIRAPASGGASIRGHGQHAC